MKRILIIIVLCATSLAFGPSTASAASCVDTGPTTVCRLGDTGPGGGIIFYDAGSLQWWGRYLEYSPDKRGFLGSWTNEQMKIASIYADGANGLSKAQQQLRSKGIGMGKMNTAAIIAQQNGASAAKSASDYQGGNRTDWYLPSKDELNALYDWSALNGKAAGTAPQWSSSEAGDGFAWYQLFADGTQFTDANGIIRGLKSNKAMLKTPMHVGSDFAPEQLLATAIRAFPASTGTPPPPFAAPLAPTVNTDCKPGGLCKLGDVGPGGGIIFHDAGVDDWWGRYLEVAPASCEGSNLPFKVGAEKPYATTMGGQTAAELRVLAKRVGMGKVNTRILTVAFGRGSYAAKFAEDSVCGGKDDWFLPSKDELDLVYNNIAQNRPLIKDSSVGQPTPLGGFDKGYYWTSTDYNGGTAWTQYFNDGQQFDRVQTLTGNKKPVRPFKVRPIRAFGSVEVKTCAQGGLCNVGDVGPGGGKVFYVAPDFLFIKFGYRYMEAAPSDIGFPSWCDWKGLVGTKTAIGTGQSNTTAMVQKCQRGAANSADTYVSPNGTSDWFLPSKDELNQLYKQRDLVGGFATDYYWSSSEGNAASAWGQYFGGGSQTNGLKSYTIFVRPVRAFG